MKAKITAERRITNQPAVVARTCRSTALVKPNSLLGVKYRGDLLLWRCGPQTVPRRSKIREAAGRIVCVSSL